MAPSPDDILSLLHKRARYLRALADQPRSKRALVDDLETPRSTLDDIMRELDTVDLVSYEDGKWQLTLLGQCAICAHDSYQSRIESLASISNLLGELSRDIPLETEFLHDADVHEAEATVPDHVANIVLDAVSEARYVRGFTPIVIAAFAEPFYTQTIAGSTQDTEVILPRAAANRLDSIFPDSITMAQGDGVTGVFHGPLPDSLGLWIIDKSLAIAVVFEERGIRGVVENDTDAALDWATALYECVRRDATPLEHADSVSNSLNT